MDNILKQFGYKPLPMVFSETGCRYKLKGIPFIGTTTVLSCRAKKFLMFWTVKEMYLYLIKNWDISKVYDKDSKEELLMKGKKAWAVKKDKALDSGKITHELIHESILNDKRFKLDEIEHENEQCLDEIRNGYQAFLDWEKSTK